MLLLQAQNIVKNFGDRELFRFDELTLYSGEHVGIVGANGAGKTTLLKLLLGQLEQDEGRIERRCAFAYVGQLDGAPESGFGENAAPRAEKSSSVGEVLSSQDVPDSLSASGGPEDGSAYASQLAQFQVAGKERQTDRSGGETTRLKLAAAFSKNVPLLAADEPTTNLDLDGVEMLTARLRAYEGALLLISHDRALLDAACDKIWEVSDGAVTEYYGGYSAYKAVAEERAARKQAEYEQYIAERSRLEAAIAAAHQRASGVRKAPKRMGNSEARLHKREAAEAAEKLSGAAKGLESRLAQLEEKEKPAAHLPIRIDLSLTDPPRNRVILSASGLNFSYGDRRIFRDASFEVPNFRKTALIGPNGAGKTTLLRLLTGGNGGFQLAPKAKIGYFSQNFENLDPNRSILENVLRDSVQPQEAVRTILARLSFRRESVHKPVGVLSGGERIKTAMAALVCSENNFLVLDEPTNYLDVESIEALQEVLRSYEGAVLVVSHDRAFLDAVADRLLILQDGVFRSFEGNYSAWRRSLRRTPENVRAKDETLMLDLKIAELTTRIGANPPDRDELLQEWERLVARRNAQQK